MNETQKRIKAYQKALPGMKERVSAVALLLAMSIAMMTSATFAWVTLSRSPEISGMATTVTTNGNLEIALSDIDGEEPDETTVNDGGKDVTKTNLTWGNLINLSDAGYGLDYLTLRPASLNSSNLITSPLYAVQYSEDGRVEGYFTDFSFSNYDKNTSAFSVPSTGIDYGVRAVSSVTYQDVAGEAFFKNQMTEINKNAANAKNIFNQITGNNTYMSAISALVGIHVSVALDDTDISCVQHIDALVGLITDFQASVDAVGQTMVDIANLHLYIELRQSINEDDTIAADDKAAVLSERYESQKNSLEDLKENNYNNAFVAKYKNVIAGLYNTSVSSQGYVQLARKTAEAYDGIMAAKQTHITTGNVYWRADLEASANELCNMSTATLEGQTVSQLSSDIMGAAGMIFSGKVLQARINGGALKDLDVMLGEPTMTVENIPISVKVPEEYGGTKIPFYGGTTQTIVVDVTTAAKEADTVFILPGDLRDAEETVTTAAGASYKGQAIAAETYAMAIDFWVRTNDANPLLILEGEYLYREERAPVYGLDASGQEVPLYTYTTTVDGEEVSYDVYQVVTTDENGDEVTTWYYAADHSELTAEVLNGATPTAKEEITRTVIGYEGVNRVWDELDDPNSNASQQIFGTSSTQGSGSCYIFYPESPEDQAQGLRILSNMRVAFADEAGELLGQASLDTDNAIEDAGRVIVPLQMMPQAPVVVGVDTNGDPVTSTDYITRLVQNEATRITALIYLEGSNLSNSDVLAAGSINGQLNIQFGTNEMELEPLKDPDVMGDYYTFEWMWPTDVAKEDVTTTNEGYVITYDETEGGYSEESKSLELKLLLTGAEPSSIKGNFVSYISATQGAREDVFTMFKDEETGIWEAYHYVEGANGADGAWVKGTTFGGPGLYRLRSLQIDGVDIVLPEDQHITYEIAGISINKLTCDGWGSTDEDPTFSIMTAQDVYHQKMFLDISSDSYHDIQGVFLGDNDKTVTVNFVQDGNRYVGTANFSASGTYKLTYLIVDGTYTQLNSTLYKTLSIRLGLRVNIVVNQPMDPECLQLQDTMADTTLTDAEKALLSNYPALADIASGDDTLDDEEKKLVEVQLADLLSLLHHGNGIEGDENENGLQLELTNGNWSYIQDGTTDVYMDVSCTIADDQGNPLENLGNVILCYNTGVWDSTRIDPTVYWNAATSRYEGTLHLGTSIGVYSFERLTINGAKNTITAASTAPTITAVSPVPMSYVQLPEPDELTYDLSADTRTMSIKLKNAAAATLRVTLMKENSEGKMAEYGVVELTPSGAPIGEVSEFLVNIQSDGHWAIAKAEVKTVFYEGHFYSGAEDDWLELELDKLFELTGEDEGDYPIDTYFLTEARLSVTSTGSNSYDGVEFMSPNTVSVQLSLVDSNGNPLEKTLKEQGVENAEVAISLSYAMTADSFTAFINTYSPSDTSKLPAREFTAVSTDDYGSVAARGMEFRLPGTYNPVWSVTVDVDNEDYEDYTYEYNAVGDPDSDFFTLSNNFIKNPVKVSWVAPDVKITGVSTDTHDGVELPGEEVVSGISNYYEDYYASTYFYVTGSFLGENSFAVPQVQMTGISGMGNAVSAVVTAHNSNNSFSTTYQLSTSNNWTEAKEIGGTAAGGYQRSVAGTVTADKVVLSDGTVNYTFNLPSNKTITINNAAYPHYLTLSADTTKVDMPATITCTNYKGETFTVNTGGASSVRIFSPDGRKFSVKLPSATGSRNENEYTGGTESGYTVDSNTATQKVYVRSGLGIPYVSPYKYTNYNRITYYTTTESVATTYRVDTVADVWVIDGVSYNADSWLENINSTVSATASISEQRTQVSVESVIRYKYYVKDTQTGSNQTSHNGGTKIDSEDVYSDYTYLGEASDKTETVSG